jgi:hypothetical protein
VSQDLVATEFQQRMYNNEEKGNAICSFFNPLHGRDNDVLGVDQLQILDAFSLNVLCSLLLRESIL